MKREKADDFARLSEWLRSERLPFNEEDYAAMRRGVWREIEARREPEGAFRPGKLVFAGGALLAAALVAALWLRSSAATSVAAVRTSAGASTPAAVDAAIPQLPVSVPPATAVRRSARAAPLRPAARRPTKAESVPVKIEFQTANPDVRIIWLVRSTAAAPRPPSASRNQEVS
jgi:hypothetical protein